MAGANAMLPSATLPEYTFSADGEITLLDIETKAGPPPWSFTVGRGGSNDIVVDDPSVSDQHSIIEIHQLTDGSFRLKLIALQTTNPTKISALKCSPGNKYNLRDGAKFNLGAVSCVVEKQHESAAATVADHDAAGGTQAMLWSPPGHGTGGGAESYDDDDGCDDERVRCAPSWRGLRTKVTNRLSGSVSHALKTNSRSRGLVV